MGLAGCGPPRAPTFSGDVAPILYRHCAACHRPGGVGPFPLLDYAEVRARGPLIEAVTGSRRMPPWLPSAPRGRFVGERALTADEIETIRRWVEDGMPEGDPSRLPPRPERGEWALGPPDLVVQAPEPYLLPAGGPEVFRNLVVPLPLERGRWVAAVDLDPGGRGVVHHATLLVDPTGSARRVDAEDSTPGYDGMRGAPGVRMPAGFFIAWTPGKVPVRAGNGIALGLEPGTDLVLQLHLRPTDHPVTLRPRIGLYFADRAPDRTPVVAILGSKSIDIPAGEARYVVADSIRLPVDVEVLGLYPHAHYLAREMRIWAERPDGSTETLLEIPRWDLAWQDEYRYSEPIRLPAGSAIRIRYTYDNSAANERNPNHPPRRVTYGPHATDEMADVAIQLVARRKGDTGLLRERVQEEIVAEVLDALRFRVERDPDDASAHQALAYALQRTGRAGEALAQYRRAAELAPEDPEQRYNLGLALVEAGRPREALVELGEAARLDTGWPLPPLIMAQVLARVRDPALRDPVRARRLARRAAGLARAAGDEDLATGIEERLTTDRRPSGARKAP